MTITLFTLAPMNYSFKPIAGLHSNNFMISMMTIIPADEFKFAGVKFHHPISSGLKKLLVINPTPIQKSAIGPLTAGISAILHAETGSGKTLAYLLPLLKRLYYTPMEERKALQALIIVPTKELAVQIGADINSLTEGEEGGDRPVVHICISSSKFGFDKVTAPIVVGTPFKIKDCITSSSKEPFTNLQYLVLDEVDRLVATVGKYASNDELRASRKEDSPARDLIERIVTARDKYKTEIQIVAASATVGRPLRRSLYSLCRLGNVIGGGEEYGNFPVISPVEETIVDSDRRPTRSVLHAEEDEEEEERGEEEEEGNRVKARHISVRAVGIPTAISHLIYLKEDENEGSTSSSSKGGSSSNSNSNSGLIGRLGSAKEIWTKATGVKRGLLFVPKVEDVKQVLGVLRFWGMAEAVSLQDQLGIETEKPVAINRRSSSATSSASASLTAPKTRSTTSDLLLRAASSRIGTAGLATSSNSQRELFVVPFTGSRGLHVQDVDMVLVLSPPKTMDEYVHLAGRTGRAGRAGQVVSFVDLDELKRLQSWQTPLGIAFDVKM